jgi:hypothetical protein
MGVLFSLPRLFQVGVFVTYGALLAGHHQVYTAAPKVFVR